MDTFKALESPAPKVDIAKATPSEGSNEEIATAKATDKTTISCVDKAQSDGVTSQVDTAKAQPSEGPTFDVETCKSPPSKGPTSDVINSKLPPSEEPTSRVNICKTLGHESATEVFLNSFTLNKFRVKINQLLLLQFQLLPNLTSKMQKIAKYD